MSAIQPDTERADLAAVDWAIPCEYSDHVGDAAADLAVWLRPICEHSATFRYMCDACLTHRNSGAYVYCPTCAAREAPPTANVLRVERIGAPS